jgi:hypothetical protein
LTNQPIFKQKQKKVEENHPLEDDLSSIIVRARKNFDDDDLTHLWKKSSKAQSGSGGVEESGP